MEFYLFIFICSSAAGLPSDKKGKKASVADGLLVDFFYCLQFRKASRLCVVLFSKIMKGLFLGNLLNFIRNPFSVASCFSFSSVYIQDHSQ